MDVMKLVKLVEINLTQFESENCAKLNIFTVIPVVQI